MFAYTRARTVAHQMQCGPSQEAPVAPGVVEGEGTPAHGVEAAGQHHAALKADDRALALLESHGKAAWGYSQVTRGTSRDGWQRKV